MSTDRRCRDCTACCTVCAVEEIAKPEQERCEHLRSSKPGCGIYEDRPASCRDWSCAWLQGYGTTNDRPDKLGVILDACITIGGPTIQAREAWMGGFWEPRAQAAIKDFARNLPVVLMFHGGKRKLIGPHRIVRMMEEAALDGTAEASGGFVPPCEHGLLRSQCRPCMTRDIEGGAR